MFAALVLALAAPAVDCQQTAEETAWKWNDEAATLGHAALLPHRTYDIRVEVKAAKVREVKVTFGKDGKDAFTLTAHRNTVFRVVSDTLVYTLHNPSASGASVAAVDLKTGKELWKTHLKGIGPVSHFEYSNYLNMEADRDTITVFGNESFGKYVEILDTKTGKTVGHKVFPKDKPEPKEQK